MAIPTQYYAGAPATKNLVMKVIPEAAQRTYRSGDR